ncbi:MAG: hypothetical protein KDD66_12590 [Bdellovibrionales bacterium]|nr:hypothetical protein [Bdellovibrionales bacterium]
MTELKMNFSDGRINHFCRAAAAALSLVLALLVAAPLVSGWILFTNDFAVSLAVADGMLHGEMPLLGPPSHVGGRHLGPAYYWYLATVYALSGKSPFVCTLLLSLLKIAALCVLLYLTSVHLRHKAKVIGVCTIALSACCGFWTLWILRTPWHASSEFVSTTLLLLAFHFVLEKGREAFGWYILAASFCIQMHLAAAPLLAVISAVAVARCLKSNIDELPSKRSVAPAIVLLVLLWLPPLIAELFAPSNISSLLQAHGAENSAPRIGLLGSVDAFSVFAADVLSPQKVHGPEIGDWILLLVLAFGAVLYIKRNRSLDRTFAVSLLAAIFIHVVAIAFVRAPLRDHFWFPILPLLLVLFGLGGGALFELARSHKFPRSSRAVGSLALASAVICLAPGIYTNSVEAFFSGGSLWRYNMWQFETLNHAQELTKIIRSNQVHTPFELKVVGPAPLRQNAYYFFLGPKFFHAMYYQKYFFELSTFNGNIGNETRILIRCGPPLPNEKNTHNAWKTSRGIPLADCESCSSCYVEEQHYDADHGGDL